MNSLNYQQILKGLAFLGIVIAITMPHLVFELIHMVFELVVELLHMAFELIVEGGHLLFEYVEISLDTVVELLFETDLHNTQIIVFYIIMSIIGFFIFRLSLRIPAFYRRQRDKLTAYVLWRKNRITLYWNAMGLRKKLQLLAIALGIISYMLFFSM